jgi:hypothetical protein
MDEDKRSVVLTGAAGLIGRTVAPLLPADWAVRRTDLTRDVGIDVLDLTLASSLQAVAAWPEHTQAARAVSRRPAGVRSARHPIVGAAH